MIGLVSNTGKLSKSIVHFQTGCGQVYDSELEQDIYFDEDSLTITDEDYFCDGACNISLSEVRRTIIEVEKISVVQKLVLSVEDWERYYVEDEEICFNY